MRTYEVRTYGCQMNVHDSERLRGLLEDAGYVRAPEGDQADVVVFNTCAVRENADNKLYGNLGHLAPVKAKKPGMQIAVGGCLAQKDKATITKKAPWVDVVFGTHNIGSLPVLLERARVQEESQVEILESLDVFPSTLPTRRESPYSAWVSVSVGCNNTCTFCIVPALRGREKDRRPGDVLAEVEALVAEGVLEVTLLGQNVNSYGVEFGDRYAFGKLLRACGTIDGLERVRFTSPHPRDFTADVIEAMAETPNVMPSLHMPLQSGSDRILKTMRRSYRRDRYLKIIEDVRVGDAGRRDHHRHHRRLPGRDRGGLPGHARRGPAGPLRRRLHLPVLQAPRHSGRVDGGPGPARRRPGAVRAAGRVAGRDGLGREQEDRRAVASRCWWPRARAARTPPPTGCRGRARDNRLVHFALPEGVETPRPGDLATVEITYARPAPPGRRRLRFSTPYARRRRVGAGAGSTCSCFRCDARDADDRRERPSSPPSAGARLGDDRVTSPPAGDSSGRATLLPA